MNINALVGSNDAFGYIVRISGVAYRSENSVLKSAHLPHICAGFATSQDKSAHFQIECLSPLTHTA